MFFWCTITELCELEMMNSPWFWSILLNCTQDNEVLLCMYCYTPAKQSLKEVYRNQCTVGQAGRRVVCCKSCGSNHFLIFWAMLMKFGIEVGLGMTKCKTHFWMCGNSVAMVTSYYCNKPGKILPIKLLSHTSNAHEILQIYQKDIFKHTGSLEIYMTGNTVSF